MDPIGCLRLLDILLDLHCLLDALLPHRVFPLLGTEGGLPADAGAGNVLRLLINKKYSIQF